ASRPEGCCARTRAARFLALRPCRRIICYFHKPIGRRYATLSYHGQAGFACLASAEGNLLREPRVTRLVITALIAACPFVTAAAQTLSPYAPLTIPLKIEQVPGNSIWYSTG